MFQLKNVQLRLGSLSKTHVKIFVSQKGFSNMDSVWLVAVQTAYQMFVL